MRRLIVTYGVGYGRHTMELDFEDDVSREDIEESVADAVTERLDWAWTFEDQSELKVT